MTDNHPITPSPELVNQWRYEDHDEVATSPRWYGIVCTKAAQWGADQELEACVEWFKNLGYHPEVYRDLLAARRPKPLKELALEALSQMDQMEDKSQISDGYHTFAELYQHRYALFLALVSTMPECFVMSRFHSDGKLCFGNYEWFIIIGELPTGGQISYHLPASLWDVAEKTGVQVAETALKWNGHTSEDVVDSLFIYATS